MYLTPDWSDQWTIDTPHNHERSCLGRHLLDKVVMASPSEQRAKRRWGIFFKLAALAISSQYWCCSWTGGILRS